LKIPKKHASKICPNPKIEHHANHHTLEPECGGMEPSVTCLLIVFILTIILGKEQEVELELPGEAPVKEGDPLLLCHELVWGEQENANGKKKMTRR
jgi:hypothetical protein